MKKVKNRKKISKKKKLILIITTFLLICLVGVLACSSMISKTEEEVVVEEIIEEEVVVTPITIVDIDSTSRPYAVMINNIDAAREYHSGLQDAYIMYEIIVEGGITRYMALFKDVETEVIGSVRSSRHYYIDYVLENDAIYAHWGGSSYALSDISLYDVDNINGTYYEGTYFYRDNTLNVSYEHTGYTSMSLLTAAAENFGYRLETDTDLLFEYSGDAVVYEDASIAINVDIVYSDYTTSSFVYDEENKYYLMSVNGVEHTDYVTKEQYHYKNIITYKVDNETMSGESVRQELYNIGSGEGYYISNGEVIEILWEKTSRESQTIYTVKATGEELVVNDGNTYIGIQPIEEILSIY